MRERILEIKDLNIGITTKQGNLSIVNGVSFSVHQGEILGIVGESGCGKSMTAYSIMGLTQPPIKITGGNILLDGKDLVSFSKKQMKQVRGKRISMIFQEPMTSLNPVYTIGNQIGEMIKLHCKTRNKNEIKLKVIELLKMVGIPLPESRFHEYPHQLSGGMRQRAMIAIAIACNPDVLIADEPTTALDVTTQSQILRLLKKLREDHQMAIILITHDLGVVAEMCDRVAVMYAGEIVESGYVDQIFCNPLHPYTKGLLNSIPRIDQSRNERLRVIPGTVPDLSNRPKGCKFYPRCEKATSICKQEPTLIEMSDDHYVKCWEHHKREWKQHAT